MKKTQKENNIGSANRLAGSMRIFGTNGIFRRFISLSGTLPAGIRGIIYGLKENGL